MSRVLHIIITINAHVHCKWIYKWPTKLNNIIVILCHASHDHTHWIQQPLRQTHIIYNIHKCTQTYFTILYDNSYMCIRDIQVHDIVLHIACITIHMRGLHLIVTVALLGEVSNVHTLWLDKGAILWRTLKVSLTLNTAFIMYSVEHTLIESVSK